MGALTGLRTLYLSDTAIDDDGLAHLKSLVGLEVLGLGGTRINGSGLRHLHAVW